MEASRAGWPLTTLLREAIGSYGEGILRNEEIAIVAGKRFDHALRMLLVGIALLSLASMGLMLVEVS